MTYVVTWKNAITVSVVVTYGDGGQDRAVGYLSPHGSGLLIFKHAFHTSKEYHVTVGAENNATATGAGMRNITWSFLQIKLFIWNTTLEIYYL